MSDLIGKSLGRYHIVEQLGIGGMATVYKAYDTRLERDVAVKVIRREAFSSEVVERMLKRFEREAKSLAKLTHPNIVNVHDYGEYEGSPYLVMQYLPGDTLKGKIGKLIPYQDAARLLEPIARAIEYAHERNIIHRDVKPSNILLTDKEQPMLADFGIAKILESEGVTTLTGTGVGVGTPAYMAPEQWEGNSQPQSDIYGLGVVFYELLTGIKPYDAETPAGVLRKLLTEPLPRPRDIVPNLPDEVEKVLFKALAKQPEARYGDMGAFASVLEKLASQEDTGAIPILLDETPIQEAETISDEPPLRLDKTPVTKATPTLLEEIETEDVQEPEEPVDVQPHRRVPRWAWLAGGGLVGLIIVIMVVSSLVSSGREGEGMLAFLGTESPAVISIQPVLTETEIPTTVEPNTPTLTYTPTLTFTPTRTFIPTITNTPTKTATLGIGSTMISSKDGMVLVYVPAGEFLMGSNDYPVEQPIHTVYLDAYWIDRTEVTHQMYVDFLNEMGTQVAEGTTWLNLSNTEIRRSSAGDWVVAGDLAEYPAQGVKWYGAAAYCDWAGRRLPTEAEWEKAARGTDGRTYPWGENNLSGNLLNFADVSLDVDWADESVDDGYEFQAPVGSYPDGASPYGALDMAGNVQEWVADWYDDVYYANSPVSNPQGPSSGTSRVLRGGSFGHDGRFAASARRNWGNPTHGNHEDGFRCLLSP
jgi:serine/threonine-protein kinase